MDNLLQLFYKTQDTPLIILIVCGLVLILIAIIYLVFSQSKNVYISNYHDNKDKEETNYNIFNSENEEVEEIEKEEVLFHEVKDDDEIFDLKNLTKELESLPKERTIKLTPFELEQEEQAIISYDELVTQSIPKLEISRELRDEVLTEYEYNVSDLEEIKEVVEEVKTSNVVHESSGYDHEESFLDNLKDLKNSLN